MLRLFGFATRLPPESYLLRGGPGCYTWGDPYTHTCLAAIIDGVAWLQGLATATPTRAALAGAVKLMREQGFDRVEWDRLNHGLARHIVAKPR